MTNPTKQALRDAGLRVKPLEWRKSHIDPWDGDYHTIPTWGKIRGLGNEDYHLSYPGGLGVYNSPEVAKAAAQSVYETRILSALIEEAGE